MSDKTNKNYRNGAALIAIIAGITLLTRVILKMQQVGGVWDSISHLTQFFTILTNFLVFVMMTAIASGRDIQPKVVRAVIISIVCVGLIYHALLAHLLSLSGLDLIADHGVHTVVPALSFLWWLMWAEKPPLGLLDPVIWVVWPLTYTGYILIRASSSEFYPYPFLNFPEIGASQLSINIVGLTLSFIVVGLVITSLARVLKLN